MGKHTQLARVAFAPFAERIKNRRIFEGYTLDSDGTSMMDDGFNIIEHAKGYSIQFFIADTSLYYEHVDKRPKPRRQSHKPNLGDDSDTLKPMSFSLDVGMISPVVAITAEVDFNGNFLSVDAERALFNNVHAYSISEFNRERDQGNPKILKWKSIVRKIKEASDKTAIIHSSLRFNFCESLASFGNYALTFFCTTHNIPLIYQNRSAFIVISEKRAIEFYAKDDVLNSLGIHTEKGEKKYNLSYASTPGKIEYSAIPKGNATKGFAPYARFSSPIRLVHDTINVWNLTEFLEHGKNTDFDFHTLEKIARQQTAAYQSFAVISEEKETGRLEKDIADIFRSPNRDEKIKTLPVRKLSAILSYLFTLEETQLISLARDIKAYKKDDDLVSSLLDQFFTANNFSSETEINPKKAARRIKNASCKKRPPSDLLQDKERHLKSSFIHAMQEQLKQSLTELCSRMIVFPFVNGAYNRVDKEIDIDFFLTLTLGNPGRNDQETLLGKVAARRILFVLSSFPFSQKAVAESMMKPQYGIDETYSILRHRNDGKIAFQPFIRTGGRTLSVKDVSICYDHRDFHIALSAARYSLLQALFKDELVHPEQTHFSMHTLARKCDKAKTKDRQKRYPIKKPAP